MKKICIIGGPSSGKTTAALLLGAYLKMKGYEVHFVLEYATNYIIRNGEPKDVFEQLAIFCLRKTLSAGRKILKKPK